MSSPIGRGGGFTALHHLRMVISLAAGIGLIVTAIVLFSAGQPAGVAALMFGVILTGLGIFNIWLLVRLRRATKQHVAIDPSESA